MDVSIVASGSFDYKKEFDNLNEAELMYVKLIPLCKMMKEYRLFNHGFYWDFLGDFFINLKDYDHLMTACYLMCSCLNKEEINNWLEDNNDKVNKFLAWYEK